MIDLHTHSFLSDGELVPAELVYRATHIGYRAIAITDHVDFSNAEHVLSCLKKTEPMRDAWTIDVLIGVEITHVPPAKMEKMVALSKRLGAEVVVVHGETMNEPVARGTNMAACGIDDVDILAHPGFITLEEAELAREHGVHIEITTRNGHNRTNGHVARIAQSAKARMVVDTDSHAPEDLVSAEFARKVAMGAGLDEQQAYEATQKNPMKIVEEKLALR
ncbi:MAG: histidinol phosphate phosphatase domain-containing protein [Methermicoccaceae archaeon]